MGLMVQYLTPPRGYACHQHWLVQQWELFGRAVELVDANTERRDDRNTGYSCFASFGPVTYGNGGNAIVGCLLGAVAPTLDVKNDDRGVSRPITSGMLNMSSCVVMPYVAASCVLLGTRWTWASISPENS